MRNRANWYLPLAALVFAALLGLPGSAAADASPAPEIDLAAKDVKSIDMADAVIPDANHYKCYPILGHSDFRPLRVHLKDQFWSTKVEVLRPVYLCNPVRKTTEDGTSYEPPQPEAHLVCYEIREDPPTRDWEVRTLDQFGWLNLRGNAASLLCLPAAKHVIIHPGGLGGTGN